MNTTIINPSEDSWQQLTQRPQMDTAELEGAVTEILGSVRQNGDEALKGFSLQFDGFAPDHLLVTPDEILAATISIDKDLKKAILIAKNNIEKLKSYGNYMIEPTFGELASGLIGEGRMAEPVEIISFLQKEQKKKLPLTNKKALVTVAEGETIDLYGSI